MIWPADIICVWYINTSVLLYVASLLVIFIIIVIPITIIINNIIIVIIIIIIINKYHLVWIRDEFSVCSLPPTGNLMLL